MNKEWDKRRWQWGWGPGIIKKIKGRGKGQK
jgi:hypothetical protein